MTLGEPPGLPSSQRRGQLQPIPNLPALLDRLGLSGEEAGGWLLWCGAWDPRQVLSGHSQGAKLRERSRLEWREGGRTQAETWLSNGESEMLPFQEEVGTGGAPWKEHGEFSLPPSVLLRQEFLLQSPLCPLGAFWPAGDPGCFLPI